MLKTLYKKAVPYLPSPGPLILYLFAWGLLIVGLIAAIAYGYGAYEGTDRFENFGFVFGFLVLPAAVVLTEIGTLIERKIPAKVALGISGTLFLLLAALIGGTAFSFDPEMDLPFLGGIGMALICFGPFVLISLILPIYALVRLPKAVREIRQAQREAQAAEAIQGQEGQITYETLAEALNCSIHEVDELLYEMLQSGQIAGIRRPQHQIFFTDPALTDRQRHLLGMIHAQGAVSLDEMTRELHVPEGLVREWIYELVQAGKFTGYLNWDEEMVYSREARSLRESGTCPNCGGAMGLAGKGVIRCDHCGTEVFLATREASA
jgi:DNA-binding Lrp family transcriptional regulator